MYRRCEGCMWWPTRGLLGVKSPTFPPIRGEGGVKSHACQPIGSRLRRGGGVNFHTSRNSYWRSFVCGRSFGNQKPKGWTNYDIAGSHSVEQNELVKNIQPPVVAHSKWLCKKSVSDWITTETTIIIILKSWAPSACNWISLTGYVSSPPPVWQRNCVALTGNTSTSINTEKHSWKSQLKTHTHIHIIGTQTHNGNRGIAQNK